MTVGSTEDSGQTGYNIYPLGLIQFNKETYDRSKRKDFESKLLIAEIKTCKKNRKRI